MTSQPLTLYYTFGNHMHWVDMEWLWGYGVLPDSVRDMLNYCNQTGAKGNINFDGIGYEKMAVEAPEALAELREAVRQGQIEVVGASYGQPYGLFHGGESNVRQRIYGVRTVMRLLDVHPKTFWEEEFDFFPQLPQILKGVGYDYASLFFQWTWHTPEVPHEDIPVVWWEGMDGSQLLTATRNDLNLHQWPEDFALLLESDRLREMPMPAIIQWLELMPSPDWMCRSELMLPQLQSLIQNSNFDLRFVTLSEYLELAREYAETRRYTMDDVFHGMSLGKNGDLFRRLSRKAEQQLLAAESLSAMVGLFGRPYPHWDVYPAWELDEAWRELLSAQHHDNDECEGLCGHVGKHSYARSLSLSEHVIQRTMQHLVDRCVGSPGRTLVYNPLGWQRNVAVQDPDTQDRKLIKDLPPFGYSVIEDFSKLETIAATQIKEDETTISLERGQFKIIVDKKRGLITQITCPEFPKGVLRDDVPLANLSMFRNGEADRFEQVEVLVDETKVCIRREGRDQAIVQVTVSLANELDAVDIQYSAHDFPRPDARMHAALQTSLAVNLLKFQLFHDHPYGVSEIQAEGTYKRKYPTGEWMTSPQVFEDVHNPFTALQLLDLDDSNRGLLYLHDGSQAMFRDGKEIQQILTMNDAWDEDYFVDTFNVRTRMIPHGKITNARRWKLAQEFNRPALVAQSNISSGDQLARFGTVWCNADNVAVSALYRETEDRGDRVESYAGNGMGFPYVLRLVELDGAPTTANITLPGTVASAFRTNLLGEIAERLEITKNDPPLPQPDEWNQIRLTLRPYEIATVYLDLVYGRKIPRNLDEHRHIWATVHRVDED